MVRQIKDKVYRTLVDTSSTPGDDITALRDLGIGLIVTENYNLMRVIWMMLY